jgi:hypothetical protein
LLFLMQYPQDNKPLVNQNQVTQTRRQRSTAKAAS